MRGAGRLRPRAAALLRLLRPGRRQRVRRPPPRGASWEETLARSRALLPIERLEALYFLARAARRAGREADARAAFAEARPLLPSGLWFARRFAALGIEG
ncbi:hypothetical protein WMF45_13095 [Sorangium sp. So ce448]|uniref:hypothetical protein n=1 Tax=Sorangium sp. So ce448 TaxID=3133314 RepID=UPI003F629B37